MIDSMILTAVRDVYIQRARELSYDTHSLLDEWQTSGQCWVYTDYLAFNFIFLSFHTLMTHYPDRQSPNLQASTLTFQGSFTSLKIIPLVINFHIMLINVFTILYLNKHFVRHTSKLRFKDVKSIRQCNHF